LPADTAIIHFPGRAVACLRRPVENPMSPKFAAIPSFSEIISQIGEAIWVIGPTGHWVFVNPTFAKFIGIQADEVYSHALFDYIHPDDKGSVAEGFEQLKKAGEMIELRYRLIHREGVDVWVSSVVTAVRDSARQIQYYVGTSRKVSAESAGYSGVDFASGAKQQALPGAPDIPFELVIMGMATPVWVVDIARNFVFSNPAFNLYVGFSQEELVGKTIEQLINDKSRDLLDASIKRLVEGEENAEVEIEFRKREGWNESQKFVIRPVRSSQGAIQFFIGNSRGEGEIISESALPDPTAPYRETLEKIGAPSWISDAKGQFIFVNGAFCTTFGLRPGEIPSEPLQTLVHPDDQGIVKSALQDLRTTDTVKLTFRFCPVPARIFWVDLVLSGLKTKEEGLIYVVATAHDMTRERELENQTIQLRDRLQAVIDQIPDAILATDNQGKIRVINQRVPDLLDMLELEIIEQSLTDVFGGSASAPMKEILEKALGGKDGTSTITLGNGSDSLPLILKYAPLMHEGVIDGAVFVLKSVK